MIRSVISAAAMAFVIGAGPVVAQEEEQEEPKSPFKPFETVVGDAEMQEGFFDVYEKTDKLFLAIPQNKLDQDFLLTFEIARGIGARGLFGGTMLNIFEGKLVTFERRGNTVLLVQKPHRYPAEASTAAARAVDLTFGSSVLETAKIATIREDSAIIIDILPWALSDISGVGNPGQRCSSGRVRARRVAPTSIRGRSYLESIKVFPENLNVRTKLTFRPTAPVSINSVPDSRYIPISVHMTMAALPEVPMEPRVADDRMGLFHDGPQGVRGR